MDIETSFEWAEYLDVVYVRVVTREGAGEAAHALDAYLYHHVGTGLLHCLALSDSGGVYEGQVAARGDGRLEIELSGVHGDRKTQEVVLLEIERDGTLRQRVWSCAGESRTILLDLVSARVDPTRD